MRSANKHLWRDADGTALVEAAILLPLLFMLIFGAMEFSWLISQRHRIEVGVAEAARYIAQSPNPNDAMTQLGAKLLATTGDVEGGSPTVRGWSAENIKISYTTIGNPRAPSGESSFRGGSILENVTVSTSLVLPSLGFFSVLRLSPPETSASHTERVIGSD